MNPSNCDSAKLAFADAILKMEAESSLLSGIGAATVELSRQYREGKLRAERAKPNAQGPKLLAHFDGGADPNPGPAACGVVLRNHARKVVHEAGYFLGDQTNNSAEYHGLLKVVQIAINLGASELEIYSDSMLVVMQIAGKWKVKHADMKRLHTEAMSLLRKIPNWHIEHIPREQNAEADSLAGRAILDRADVIEVNGLAAAN